MEFSLSIYATFRTSKNKYLGTKTVKAKTAKDLMYTVATKNSNIDQK